MGEEKQKKPKKYKDDSWQSVGEVSVQESSPHAFRKFFTISKPKKAKDADKEIENICRGSPKK